MSEVCQDQLRLHFSIYSAMSVYLTERKKKEKH